MNIDEMPAGREMDALIAEKMGYKAYKETRGGYAIAVMQRPGDREPWKSRQRPDPERYTEISCVEAVRLGFFGTGFPNFSTDIAAALPIAEKLNISLICSEDGWYAVKTEDVVHTCNREPNIAKEIHGKYWALADTIPLAICSVGLKALGVTEV